jgi:hypothetical protein
MDPNKKDRETNRGPMFPGNANFRNAKDRILRDVMEIIDSHEDMDGKLPRGTILKVVAERKIVHPWLTRSQVDGLRSRRASMRREYGTSCKEVEEEKAETSSVATAGADVPPTISGRNRPFDRIDDDCGGMDDMDRGAESTRGYNDIDIFEMIAAGDDDISTNSSDSYSSLRKATRKLVVERILIHCDDNNITKIDTNQLLELRTKIMLDEVTSLWEVIFRTTPLSFVMQHV